MTDTQARPSPETAAETIAGSHADRLTTADRRTHTMSIRVYDWCPEYGAHTDPELRSAYADHGV